MVLNSRLGAMFVPFTELDRPRRAYDRSSGSRCLTSKTRDLSPAILSGGRSSLGRSSLSCARRAGAISVAAASIATGSHRVRATLVLLGWLGLARREPDDPHVRVLRPDLDAKLLGLLGLVGR